MDWVSEMSNANRTMKCIVQFIAMRKTLEANMQNVNMFPPGRVLWAVRENDLHPSHNSLRHEPTSGKREEENPNKLRLFQVSDVEKVFSQIVFAKDMLTSVHCSSLGVVANYPSSAHMPHQYDRVLHDLL